MTVLRDQTARLLRHEMDILGDEIVYTVAGGAPKRFNAFVEFSSEHVASTGSSATAYAKAVEIGSFDVAQPTKNDRIAITLRPGIIYAPADILEGESGESWVLPLKKVIA